MKTFVMTTGELEYDNLFFDNEYNNTGFKVSSSNTKQSHN